MFSISLLFSFVYFFIPKFSCLVFFSFFFIISIVLHFLALSSFYLFQFLSNLVQYSLSCFLSDYLSNFLAINLSGNSLLLKVSSSLSCFLTFSMSLLYFFLNSSIAFFAFPRFSFSFQVSDSTINPFYHTRYLFFSLIHCLFNIFSIFHFSSLSVMTGAGCSFLCLFTCSIYLCILLTFTTRCILIVLDNSNSTVFANIIFFIL